MAPPASGADLSQQMVGVMNNRRRQSGKQLPSPRTSRPFGRRARSVGIDERL
jgi:hypothetical protein